MERSLRATEQAFTGSSVYRYRKHPARPGQLHMKSWRYLVAPQSAGDPEWVTKAIDYWRLQAETFGLRYEDDLKLAVDYEHGIVTTFIHVAEVLPGRRERDYVTPRVAEARLTELVKI